MTQDKHYRLIITEIEMSTAGPMTTEYALRPVTTIAACKGALTNRANTMRWANERDVRSGLNPSYLTVTGRIEACTWEPLINLSTPDIKP